MEFWRQRFSSLKIEVHFAVRKFLTTNLHLLGGEAKLTSRDKRIQSTKKTNELRPETIKSQSRTLQTTPPLMKPSDFLQLKIMHLTHFEWPEWKNKMGKNSPFNWIELPLRDQTIKHEICPGIAQKNAIM